MERLISPPVLALPRFQGQYTVNTDAYDRQIGCVLLQKLPDGHNKQIGYWSSSLTDSERANNTAHRECLPVVWVVFLFRPYLKGTSF